MRGRGEEFDVDNIRLDHLKRYRQVSRLVEEACITDRAIVVVAPVVVVMEGHHGD